MARPSYTRDKRDDIESQIRNVALTLFAELGYRAVSLRAIARAMNWSAPALYRYYDSKDALLAALRADGFGRLQSHLAKARAEGLSALDSVRGAVIAYLDFAVAEPELYRLMYELDQGEIAEYPAVVVNRRKAFSEAEKIAMALLEEGGLAGDPNQLAHLMWINVHGLAALALANQLDLGQRFEQLVEPVIQSLIRGLPGLSIEQGN